MEGAPGPPQAKRPRFEEDAPCGPQSRGRAPEGGPVGTEPPRPQNPLPLLALLLGGPSLGEPTMPRGQEGMVGGRAWRGGSARGAPPQKRRAPGGPRGDEESPSPKTPRRTPKEEVGARLLGGADSGRGGAPGDPEGTHERETMKNRPSRQVATGLSSLGQARNARAEHSQEPILEMAAAPKALLRTGACPPPALLKSAEIGGGAQGPRWSRLATRGALPPRGLLHALNATAFHLFLIVPGSPKDESVSAWLGGCDILRSPRQRAPQSLVAGHVNLYSETFEARARPWGPERVELAVSSGLARLFSSSGFSAEIEEFILEEENKLKCIGLLQLDFHINNILEKHNTPLLLIVAFVRIWRDARNALLRKRRGLALLSKDRDIGQCYMESLKIDMYFLNGILASTQQKEFLKGSYKTNHFLPIKGKFLERNNLFTVSEMKNLTGLSFEFLPYLSEIPKWKVRKLKNDNHSNFLEEENGTKSVLPKKRRPNIDQGNNLLLTIFKASDSAFNLNMRYEHNKVRECMNQKEGNYVSEVTGTCHIITTENIRRDFKKHGNNSFHVIPKDTLFSVFDTFQKGPPVSNFGDTGSISLSKRDYNDNASSEKAIILQALNSRAVPQCIQATQINTTERAHKTNTNSQDTIIEKKQMFNINSFSLKGKFNSFLDIEQEVKLVHCDTLYIGPNAMTKTQEEFVGDFLSEWKEKIQNLIWNERKHPTESLTGMHSFQISNGSKIEREQKYSITTTNTMVCILKSNLLMKKKPNLEDAREINQIHGNQNNTTDRNEHQTLLQESALANSKLFHLNNESTEFVNRKFKTDLATRNNEYSPDLRAECLSTETKTMTDFEMKSKFDIVLKELCMFHEIGKEEETSLIGETRNSEEKNDFDKDNSTEEVHQVIKEDFTVVSMEKICVPSLPCDTIISVNMPKTIQSSFKWKKLHRNREKEVPHEYCSSSPSDEELLHSPSGRDFEKAFSQNPALFSDAFMEGRIHSLLKGGSGLSHGIVRVYPLKTCRRPIRIGLSRKAKPKQLHPYLK